MSPFGNKETVRGARPPALGAPGSKPTPPAIPEAVDPPDEDAGAIPANAAAVAYRTEAETCGHCSYYVSGSCEHPMVAQAVGAGDSCSAFEGSAEPEPDAVTDVETESEYA